MTSLELARRLLSKKSSVTSNVMNPGLIPTTGMKFCFFFFLILCNFNEFKFHLLLVHHFEKEDRSSF